MSGTLVDFTCGAFPETASVFAPRGWWGAFDAGALPTSYAESTGSQHNSPTMRGYRRDALERAGFTVAPMVASFQLV
jgi:hypothetical protein